MRRWGCRPIPIVTHGYDYALPDGRGYLGGFWLLPGPWLEPGFRKKGHVDFGKNSAVVVKLIDQFNAMLKDVSATPGFGHVHYLNLRNTLKHDGTYGCRPIMREIVTGRCRLNQEGPAPMRA